MTPKDVLWPPYTHNHMCVYTNLHTHTQKKDREGERDSERVRQREGVREYFVLGSE